MEVKSQQKNDLLRESLVQKNDQIKKFMQKMADAN